MNGWDAEVLRIFTARPKLGQAAALADRLTSESIELVRTQDGLVAYLAAGATNSDDELLFVTLWRDQEAVRTFAGDHWQESVLPAGYEELLESHGVEHRPVLSAGLPEAAPGTSRSATVASAVAAVVEAVSELDTSALEQPAHADLVATAEVVGDLAGRIRVWGAAVWRAANAEPASLRRPGERTTDLDYRDWPLGWLGDSLKGEADRFDRLVERLEEDELRQLVHTASGDHVPVSVALEQICSWVAEEADRILATTFRT